MYITIRNAFGQVDFTFDTFDNFKSLVASGQKINAIKQIRTMLPSWSLKECKDFVESCYFPPQPFTEPAKKEDGVFADVLLDIKDDLRSIILDKSEYRESLLLDLFARVTARAGVR